MIEKIKIKIIANGEKIKTEKKRKGKKTQDLKIYETEEEQGAKKRRESQTYILLSDFALEMALSWSSILRPVLWLEELLGGEKVPRHSGECEDNRQQIDQAG